MNTNAALRNPERGILQQIPAYQRVEGFLFHGSIAGVRRFASGVGLQPEPACAELHREAEQGKRRRSPFPRFFHSRNRIAGGNHVPAA